MTVPDAQIVEDLVEGRVADYLWGGAGLSKRAGRQPVKDEKASRQANL